MKVLVTGASGFIGNHLCSLLTQQGFKVLALVRPGSDIQKLQQLENVEFIFGDTGSPENLVKTNSLPEILFHLAADWSNLDAEIDKKFITFLIDNGLKKIIYYSSVCAAGLDMANMPLIETDEPQFLEKDFYGKYKFAVEQYISSLIRANKVAGVILRPTLVYGPGDTTNIFSLFKAIRLRKLALWEKGKRIIAPCYIQNLNTIAILAVTSDSFKDIVYYVADGEGLSTLYVTKVIAKKMAFKHIYTNKSTLLGKQKGFLIFVLNRFGFTNSFATHFAFNSWTRSYDVQLKKIQSVVDTKLLVPFEQAIEETLSWYKQQNII